MARLRELTWPEARAALENKVVLLPVGPVEQHGRHLPLGTDHVTAEAIALSAEAKRDLVVAPTLPYGVSPHHRQFFGTCTLRSEVYREVVLDIARSLRSHGTTKLVVVNGHGGATRRPSPRRRKPSARRVSPARWRPRSGSTSFPSG